MADSIPGLMLSASTGRCYRIIRESTSDFLTPKVFPKPTATRLSGEIDLATYLSRLAAR